MSASVRFTHTAIPTMRASARQECARWVVEVEEWVRQGGEPSDTRTAVADVVAVLLDVPVSSVVVEFVPDRACFVATRVEHGADGECVMRCTRCGTEDALDLAQPYVAQVAALTTGHDCVLVLPAQGA